MNNLFREIDVMITIYSMVVSMELTIFLTKVGSMAGITYYMKMSLYWSKKLQSIFKLKGKVRKVPKLWKIPR